MSLLQKQPESGYRKAENEKEQKNEVHFKMKKMVVRQVDIRVLFPGSTVDPGDDESFRSLPRVP